MSEEIVPVADPAVRAVVNSRVFQRAPTIRALLLYLWEHQGQTVSEYDIATAVLGKNGDFDPKIDATVRVHMARLRQKLRDYYETSGGESAIRLEVPPGGYRIDVVRPVAEPVLQPVESAAVLPADTPAEAPVPRRISDRHLLFALGTVTVLLAIAIVWLWEENRSLHAQAAPIPPAPWFWKPFLDNRRGIQLIYPAPVFLEWPEHRLRLRDVDIDDFAKVESSARIRRLIDIFGMPKLNQRYTVNTDAAAAVKLAKFLARYSVDLKVYSTSNYAQEANTTDHVILLGIPATNPKLAAYIPATGFRFTAGYGQVQADDASVKISIRRQSERRLTEPGVLAALPGQNPDTSVLVLAGPNSSALASLLITPSSIEDLRTNWVRSGSPKYFSALVKSETDADTVLRTSILQLRKVPASD